MLRSVSIMSCLLPAVTVLVACDNGTDVDLTPDLVAIAAGSRFTCALATDGAAYCWGANDKGQLGRETMSEIEGVGAVAGGLSFDAIAAGEHNVCGLSGGRAYCWGEGDLLDRQSPAPAPVAVEPANASFVAVTVGGWHACGLTAGGAASCWGRNDLVGGGQLGNGTITSSGTATAVVGGIAFDELSAGAVHTCGRAGAGVWCWGSNLFDAVGLVDAGATAEPRSVALEAAATSITAGALVSCAGSAAGTHCWGTNSAGQLGRGTSGGSDPSPATVSDAGALRGVVAGSVNRIISHVCGLSDAGRPVCWGVNDQGQLGRATAGTCTVGGTAVPCGTAAGETDTDLAFVALAAGGAHTCGIAGGVVYCWGGNDRGQLGAPGPGSATPVPVLFDP